MHRHMHRDRVRDIYRGRDTYTYRDRDRDT